VDADVGVVLVELELVLGAAAALDELDELELLLPQPLTTISVAASAATPSHPLRALVVTFSSF
jgi:hypothetical protein